MRKQRIIIAIVICAMLLTSGTFCDFVTVMASTGQIASGKCGDNLSWTLDGKGTLTVSGSGKMDNWIWYSEPGGMGGDRSPWSYLGNQVLNVVIESGVTSIGSYAFCECRNLKSVDISNSVTDIEEAAFSLCESLKDVKIPNSVTSIGDDTFSFCKSIKNIEIPASVTKIGEMTFYCCQSVESIVVDKNNKRYNSQNNCNAIIDSLTNDFLYGCNNSFIPDGVRSIHRNAFIECKKITSIKIPSSVTSIGVEAFVLCDSLSNIDIPSSIEVIGDGAFGSCYNLENVKLHKGLKTIGSNAFSNCNKLNEIKIPVGTKSIENNAFDGCNNLKTIYIPSSVDKIGDTAFVGTSDELTILGVYNSYTQHYANDKKIKFISRENVESNVSYTTIAEEIVYYIDEILKDQDISNGKIDGLSMDFTIKDNKYTFTPLNLDFAAGMPLSNLNYQAVIDTDSKTVKVLLGMSKDGKSEIKQTTDVNSTSWGQQYQSIKKMYKDLTGYDARTTRATWNNFEKMKSELNSLKCDMFVSADMKITGFLEFSFADDGSGSCFKEGGIIEKVSVDTNFSSPVVAPWVYISLGLGVSEEGTLKVQMNNNVPELITSLELAAKASAKISGQIPIIAKVEGMIDAKLSANIANTEPKFTVDMTGDISLKATALAGIIEVYNNTWNYLDCQIYPEFKNNNDTEIASYNSTDEMLCTASGTERIVGAQSAKLSGTDFSEQNVYSQNEARLISLSNNRKILLWLDDSRQKSNNNRTTLMYSVYDGSNWSNPEEVCNDGCFDGEFSYYVENDNTVYVVFQKGNMIFGDDTEYSDIVRNIDPYVTKFDGSTFSTPEKVRDDNNSYEDNFTITKNDSQLKVTYVEYPSDYLAGNSDTLNLMNTVNNGSEWADNMICEENSFISDYEYIGSRLYLELYNTDKGCYELYKSDNGNDELLKSLSKEVKLVSVGDKIYYVENDILNTLKADKISECQLPYGTDYKIITNGNSTKIVYEIINEDHSSALYSGDISDGTVGDTLIYRSESDYIKSYNGCIDENGNLDIATTLCTLNSDLSESNYSLNVIGREKNYSLASTYLYYDENNVVADKDLDLYYDVTNNGNENISSYNVVLYDESGNTLADSKVTTGIKVGESREEKLVYHIPKDFGEQSVYIQIQSVDGKKIYSKAETVIKHNDIEICNVQVKHMCNDDYNIECTLKNNGYQNADNVAISFNSNGDDIIKETEIEHLNSGETCTASVELTADEYACISDKTLYCEVTGLLSESDYGNNSKTIDLNKTTADGIHNWVKDEKSGKYICSICGKKIEDDYSGELKGLSLSLSDDIGLNFVMQLSDSLLIDKDNAYVEFTPEGSKKSTRVYLKDADKVNYNGSDCYSFKCRVNAAEMTKKVNAVLHCNDWTGQTYSYSVYDYASKILAEPESSEYRSSAPLIKAMLNYGGYAQTYFNENTDALANKGLYNKTNDPVLTTNTTVSKDYNYAVFNNNMGVSFLGGSLVLNSGTDLKLYYGIDDKNVAHNINVSVNGQNVAPEYDGNIMCVRVPGISISSLGDTYNVKISVNGKEINQKYSAMTYMYKALNAQNSNTKLNNVVKALYLYNEAAKQYSMGN